MKYIIIISLLCIPLLSFSQDVIYRNGWGHYIGTEKVTPKQFKQELAKNPVAFRQFKRARVFSYTGIGVGVVSAAIILTDADENLSHERLGLATISYAAAATLVFIGGMQEIGAINLYNSSLNSSTRIAPTSNGIGLVHRF